MNDLLARDRYSFGAADEPGFDGGRLVGGHGLVAPFAAAFAGIPSAASKSAQGEVTA